MKRKSYQPSLIAPMKDNENCRRDPQRQPAPPTTTEGSTNRDYIILLVIPTRTKKRKEGITMKRIALKKARLIAGMTEAEACTTLRIRKERLHAWETGKSVPSFDHAVAMAKAYDMSIDYLDFSKEANTPPAARKLTLKEIETLPFASVIWYSGVSNDNGVVWHWKLPVVVYATGKDGRLGGDAFAGIFEKDISADLFNNPNDAYWDKEPDDEQLAGITTDEYNELIPGHDDEEIVCPKLAEIITGRKMTFKGFCDQNGYDLSEFIEKIVGNKAFTCGELASIAVALHTTVDKIFSESAGQLFDIRTGKRIEQPTAAQI